MVGLLRFKGRCPSLHPWLSSAACDATNRPGLDTDWRGYDVSRMEELALNTRSLELRRSTLPRKARNTFIRSVPAAVAAVFLLHHSTSIFRDHPAIFTIYPYDHPVIYPKQKTVSPRYRYIVLYPHTNPFLTGLLPVRGKWPIPPANVPGDPVWATLIVKSPLESHEIPIICRIPLVSSIV